MEKLESSQSLVANKHTTLNLDFRWRKFKTLISDEKNPEKPLYIINYKMITALKLKFRSVGDIADNSMKSVEAASKVIGKSAIPNFKIDAEYECHGRKDTLIAQKRFKTSYTHRSAVLTNKDKPAVLSWSGNCSLSTWQFVCVDENQSPIAKFTVNIWGLKKIGKLELMGPLADNQALMDEMVVTGVTLGYLMIWRVNNWFNLYDSLTNFCP